MNNIIVNISKKSYKKTDIIKKQYLFLLVRNLKIQNVD